MIEFFNGTNLLPYFFLIRAHLETDVSKREIRLDKVKEKD